MKNLKRIWTVLPLLLFVFAIGCSSLAGLDQAVGPSPGSEEDLGSTGSTTADSTDWGDTSAIRYPIVDSS